MQSEMIDMHVLFDSFEWFCYNYDLNTDIII